MKKENQFKHKIIALKLLNEKLKGFEVIFDYNEDEDGHILGILEGVRKMNQSNKKITNQDLMNLLTRKFEDIDRKFEDIDRKFEDMEIKFNKRFKDMETKFDKRFDKIDTKIDLIIACPTIQSEIDHEALAKFDEI